MSDGPLISQNALPPAEADTFPLVSVIIPAYNAETFIAKTLASVIAQTYRRLEILVVDDGSSDRTVEIVRQFSQQDSRIRLLQQPNAGVAAARNLAIKSAQGEFIAPVDADDIWYADNIAEQVQTMQRAGPNVGLVYSWSVDIDEENQLTGGFRAAEISGDVYTTLIGHNFIGNASATMMRRSCLEQVGSYSPSFRAQQAQGCEDWDLYLRIAEHYQFDVACKFLIGYRKVSNSMSCDYQAMARSHALIMSSIQQQYPDILPYLFRLSASNLYAYFAHQSNRHRHHRTTLFWLKRAVRTEAFISFIRPGFYRLLLSSLWGLATQRPAVPSPSLPLPSNTDVAPSELQLSVIAPFKAPPLTLHLMITVGKAFHWLIASLTRVSTNHPGNALSALTTGEKP
nr:glycosyltransferase family 2 protein [Leptolyngbya sp. BC1307]